VPCVELHRLLAGDEAPLPRVEHESFERETGRHFSVKPHDLLMPFIGTRRKARRIVMHGGSIMATNANDGGSCRGIPWRVIGWGAVTILLMLPLIAMQFTTEVNCTASDFIFAAAM